MEKLYPRWQEKILLSALKTRRVLLLSGPRQCGKTTLAKTIASADAVYRTLDDLTTRRLAIEDPNNFVQHENKMLIIDEVQRAPDLLSAIKLVVDENKQPGQYLLTGSANVPSLPSVQESLAGRIRKIRLRTLAHGELLGIEPTFLENAFNSVFQSPKNNIYDRKKMLRLAFRGGYPEAIKLSEIEAAKWHKDYMDALLERDLKDIAHITRYHSMQKLVEIVAAWSGKLMDIASISSSLSIRRPTIESYLNALETLYIIENIPPWTHTDYERVGKQSKIYMTDSGLMTSILKWRIAQVTDDPDRAGKLIETFILNELTAQIDAQNGQYELFHYRDREKREIDFIIERDDQALLGIEIKAGSVISSNDFKHLKWFKTNIAKNRSFIGIVLYSGNLAGSMGENLWAVPFENLFRH